MQDINTSFSHVQQGSVQESALAIPQVKKPASNFLKSQEQVEKLGLFTRILRFMTQLFTGKPVTTLSEKVIVTSRITIDPNAAERVAIAQAAKMEPPMAFVGNTTTHLSTPMGAYAGKPVEHAMRKRAEQQFHTMDITVATKN